MFVVININILLRILLFLFVINLFLPILVMKSAIFNFNVLHINIFVRI